MALVSVVDADGWWKGYARDLKDAQQKYGKNVTIRDHDCLQSPQEHQAFGYKGYACGICETMLPVGE